MSTIGEQYCIPRNIADIAEMLDLDVFATGGGIDYVCVKGNTNIILADRGDAGSPDDVKDPCSVMIYTEEDWTMGVELQFPTSVQALNFMAGLNNVSMYGFPIS